MTLNREASFNFGENSLIQYLNDTQTSHITKESAEKDFKELEILINKEVREDKGNSSVISNTKVVDKSYSVLSNEEIWKTNKSLDDSKNFIKNFQDIDEKKKKSNFQKENKNMTKKPSHLQIKISKQEKEEDYNEDIEESIDPNENPTQIRNFEPKNNNLGNKIFPNTHEINDSRIKFYTNPDEVQIYRDGYPKNNFSFTPQNKMNINTLGSISSISDNYTSNAGNLPNYVMFPTIPSYYKISQTSPSLSTNITPDIKCLEENSLSFSGNVNSNDEMNIYNKEALNFQTTIDDITTKNIMKHINSTRNSTDSNESTVEMNNSNNYHCNNFTGRKYYTPTHNYTNISRDYNLLQVQRELNFSEFKINSNFEQRNKYNFNPANTPSNNIHRPFIINKSTVGNTNTCTSINSSVNSIFSPSNAVNSIKSLSFCGHGNNNIKSPTALKYYEPNVKLNTAINSNVEKISVITDKKDEYVDHKINLENIIIGKDKRTTLMLRNIPNKYTLQNIVDEINPSFCGKYDYINLPIDYERKLNLGYAFINFVDSMHIILFCDYYYNKKWTKYRSDKKIDLNYAEKQGKKDITCKDDNTYFAAEDKKINFHKINPKLEIPMKYHDFFKKIYPNSVCIIDHKSAISGNKLFHVKSLGKK